MVYSCGQCIMTFQKINKYIKHIENAHGRVPTFNCTKCNSYAGPSFNALKAHQIGCFIDTKSDNPTQSNLKYYL